MNLNRTKKNRNSTLGFFVGSVLGLLGKPSKISARELKKHEFKNSTRRLGVSFTDRVRNVFRNRWLKKN